MKFFSQGMLTAEREPTENMTIALADRFPFVSYRVAKIKNMNEVVMEAGDSPEMILKH